jgi:hypothetical protein
VAEVGCRAFGGRVRPLQLLPRGARPVVGDRTPVGGLRRGGRPGSAVLAVQHVTLRGARCSAGATPATRQDLGPDARHTRQYDAGDRPTRPTHTASSTRSWEAHFPAAHTCCCLAARHSRLHHHVQTLYWIQPRNPGPLRRQQGRYAHHAHQPRIPIPVEFRRRAPRPPIAAPNCLLCAPTDPGGALDPRTRLLAAQHYWCCPRAAHIPRRHVRVGCVVCVFVG